MAVSCKPLKILDGQLKLLNFTHHETKEVTQNRVPVFTFLVRNSDGEEYQEEVNLKDALIYRDKDQDWFKLVAQYWKNCPGGKDAWMRVENAKLTSLENKEEEEQATKEEKKSDSNHNLESMVEDAVVSAKKAKKPVVHEAKTKSSKQGIFFTSPKLHPTENPPFWCLAHFFSRPKISRTTCHRHHG